METKMEFYGKEDAVNVSKSNGTDVSYFIFEEYEIHLNRIAPHTVQEWHYHQKIEETLLVTKGELTAYWQEDGETRTRKTGPGGLIRVGRSIHTFSNETDEPAEFTVFRFVPEGVDKREVIKTDKIVVPAP
ncbi:cupin domain-containing protein [Lacrimispora sp. 210928-DFI.3.58]|uniref:cupin domain-containing protein n=1 Tax=Lacrimispora sp. 210928-DFI.3.58 TaxID=2883214 RepID=UPI001D0675B4|nr:cupin domain-containing protein [Lacrimispora sp. 210928-DFI.3.58]MCB7318304.1 cupin domain-containing protein [Lacrimispora sp. 210928-DFI.3.58]